MKTKFDPENEVIKRCMMGMAQEDKGNFEEAIVNVKEAWNIATDDYEKFIASFHFARLQNNATNQLKWMELSLKYAQKVEGHNVQSALSSIFLNIAKAHEKLGNLNEAKENQKLADKYQDVISDNGPFYHGTRADLQVGDLLTAGSLSNYELALKMNHIYFTANKNTAGLSAALAKGEGPEHVFIIEPTGEFENDPNVTDKKFPGNLTRSYRSTSPLKIIGEETEYRKITNEERLKWLENLAKNEGEIIN